MSVRSGRLVPLALRFGLVLGAAACAWIGYEAGDDRSARAADALPVVTVDTVVGGVTDLLQVTLPPVAIPPSVAADTLDPPRPPGSVDDGGDTGGTTPSRAGSSPTTDTREATPAPRRRTAPPADRPTRAVPSRPRTPETVAARTSRPPRDRVATPPVTAVDRVATPVVGTLPAVLDPVAGPVLGALPPVVDPVAGPIVGALPPVVDPVAGPIVGALAPVVDPLLRSLHPVLRPLEPVLQSLEPVLQPLEPVLRPLEPVLGPLEPVLGALEPVLGALRPGEVAPPAERGAGGTAEQAPGVTGTAGRPPARTAPPAPSAAMPPTGQPRTGAALADPAQTRTVAWSPAGAGADPLRPDVIPHRGAPATDTGGVVSGGGVHQPAGDASTVAWTSPATGLRLCRPDGPAPLPSRCPRPGSRPA
ncbi:hypothetical protein GA0074696_3717 [Micromonospora purpureochromogenes]|uniref:Uncharacterized protein n=1 Tax=Micromonospora purpureochromogenes TaxID=47872 RepID=A0A1C4YUQ0_9ACTN|nr:hypothetical protein [Micromonospora purpureochromogenes]SCF24404.1 hypothetical protein GA0074696_3717 [Micromonospora purpureochromogenes]